MRWNRWNLWDDKRRKFFFGAIYVIIAFTAGFFIGCSWLISHNKSGLSKRENDPPIRESGKYQFINPLITCGFLDERSPLEYDTLPAKIKKLVVSKFGADPLLSVSVYFRDLDLGKAVGINENQPFSPASLLKVPLMIAYLKMAEKDSALLSRSFEYDGSYDLNKGENFRSPYLIKSGVYSADQLLKAMIVNSDNNAASILYENIKPDVLFNLYNDLGLPVPPDDGSLDTMSAKSYSYFFRVLYNASYLEQNDFSEKALELLSGPDFPQGITSGVPDEIKVAQKFGERTVFSESGKVKIRELHDCGIIYYPKRPYLLCVMTKGSHFDDLVNILQEISRIVYSTVDSAVR